MAIGPDARTGAGWLARETESAIALRTATQQETAKRTATSYGRPKGLRYDSLRESLVAPPFCLR
jgi:hypothetical protein